MRIFSKRFVAKDKLSKAKTVSKLKQESQTLKPLINIGKNGLTENAILHINKVLKDKKLIKIKILENYFNDEMSKKESFQILKKIIEEKTTGKIIRSVGQTITIVKK